MVMIVYFYNTCWKYVLVVHIVTVLDVIRDVVATSNAYIQPIHFMYVFWPWGNTSIEYVAKVRYRK